MKLLDRVRQIITRNKECNYGMVGKSPNKKESNKEPPITKEKESNKVRRNRWGFPTFFKSRK